LDLITVLPTKNEEKFCCEGRRKLYAVGGAALRDGSGEPKFINKNNGFCW
jgi:hypothetical protein